MGHLSLQVLSYVFLRNATVTLRISYSEILQQVGHLSLWLFISHHHILLVLNGRGLLLLFPGSYYLNALAVSIVFFFVYHAVWKSTDSLNEYVFGKPTVTFTV